MSGLKSKPKRKPPSEPSLLMVRDEVYGAVRMFEDSIKGRMESTNWINLLKKMYGEEWEDFKEDLEAIRISPDYAEYPSEYTRALDKYKKKKEEKKKQKTANDSDSSSSASVTASAAANSAATSNHK